MPLMTIFTAPKPFTNPHIATIQRNAIRSWVELGAEVEVLVLGEEEGLAQACAEMGVRHIPEVARNASGTPLVSAMFDLARRNSRSPLLCCINADVILLPDVLEAARRVMEQAGEFLMVGQRWDLAVTALLDFSEGWQGRIQEWVKRDGRLHPRGGSDYFIFRRDSFKHMPAFAIGRAGWDNWMIFDARYRGAAVVDATQDIQVIHQDHDYSHLPGGQPHYRLPETFENVRMGGGKLTVFKLDDTDRRLAGGRVQRHPFNWRKFWREVEIFPLVRLQLKPLAYVAFAVFHPKKAYAEIRKTVGKKVNR